MPALRIVSLLPSTTEIACALGFRDSLVGRSHECDHPPGVEALPACTRAVFDDGTSREIDDRVKDLVQRGLSVYDVDADQLRSLAPGVILTQDQCEVCAASPRDLESAVAEWLGAKPQVVALSPTTLGDVWDDIDTVARALGAEERGRALRRELADRVSAIGEQTGALEDRPGVACIEWIDPLMTAGHWTPELLTLAGGRPLFGRPGSPSAWATWDALRDADPDAIVIAPCGFDLGRTRRELAPLLAQPGWSALRAVRAERVFLLDGNAYLNRPGPRLVETLEALAEILHPGHFSFGHRGSAWQALEEPGSGPRK